METPSIGHDGHTITNTRVLDKVSLTPRITPIQFFLPFDRHGRPDVESSLWEYFFHPLSRWYYTRERPIGLDQFVIRYIPIHVEIMIIKRADEVLAANIGLDSEDDKKDRCRHHVLYHTQLMFRKIKSGDVLGAPPPRQQSALAGRSAPREHVL